MPSAAYLRQRSRKRAVLYYRLPFLNVAAFVAALFVLSLYLIRPPQQDILDLAGNYYPSLTQEERNRHSSYNWLSTRYVDLTLQSEKEGMVILRAANREILYQSFLAKNIIEDLHLNIPKDINQIVIEYGERVEYLELEKNSVIAGVGNDSESLSESIKIN